MDNPYMMSRRRILIDMHIPDWDEDFLSSYQTAPVVSMYERANADAVMFYAQTCCGECLFPTKTGDQHRNLAGRDLVQEMLPELKKRGIATSLYYSVIFNNLAFKQNPEWRIVSRYDLSRNETFAGSKYALCCPNNPEYNAFTIAQVEEIAGAYDFDCLFLDMAFWRPICVCAHCLARYRAESGREEFPTVLDWLNPVWCEYQRLREEWTLTYMQELTGAIKAVKPGMAVYHNAGGLPQDWRMAVPLASGEASDLLGGDFYGGNAEQCFVGKLFTHLSRNRMEVMVPVCTHIKEHVLLKSEEQIIQEALRPFVFGGASLFIHAINPDGTLNEAPYARIKEGFDRIERVESFAGGKPVEDIAVYFSSTSKMNFDDNGITPEEACTRSGKMDGPHKKAVLGVCDKLQHDHLPFGVITRKDLPRLHDYKVVILPSVSRMTADEVGYFRSYVQEGGSLYASSYTSLTEVNGTRHEDFMMADLFGCHFDRENRISHNYLRPESEVMEDLLKGERFCTHDLPGKTLVYLRETAEARVLARLTRPYSEEPTSVTSGNWASIHTSPPWCDTPVPAILENHFGRGRVIYSCADIESGEAEQHRNLFNGLIRRLADGKFSYETDAHPCVLMNVFYQEESSRFVLPVLNNQTALPVIPIDTITLRLRIPEGRGVSSVSLLPEGPAIPFHGAGEEVVITLPRLELFEMIVVELQ